MRLLIDKEEEILCHLPFSADNQRGQDTMILSN